MRTLHLLSIGLLIGLTTACGSEAPQESRLGSGASRIGSSGQTDTSRADPILESYPERLVVTDHAYDPGTRAVAGTVLNNTATAYVNVQVAFALIGPDSTRLSILRDTTSYVAPGGTWDFQIPVPAELEVARTEPVAVDGTVTRETGDPVGPPAQERRTDGATDTSASAPGTPR